jgi:quercetin dioxygenase-like cupin family protein
MTDLLHNLRTRPQQAVALGPHTGVRMASGHVLKGIAEWTDGAYLVIEQSVRPGVMSRMHRHAREAQAILVLAGTLGVYVEGSGDRTLCAGDYVFRPPGLLHAIWNPGTIPAHCIEFTSPGAEFQRYVLAANEARIAGASVDVIQQLARAAGISYATDRTVTDDICARYDVSTSW